MWRGGGTLCYLWVALAFLFTGPWIPDASAQDTWNDARALDLVTRARAVRQNTITEQGLRTYSADARGYVYFFVDHDDSEERNLVKTDQVALEVFWQAPDLARQRIVGLRDERQLPTNIQYHLDHLTVVQDDFGDRIRLGDGDEVSAVVHPLAPGAEQVYDYALGDSLTIRFAGLPEPIRVYEVRVRPVDADAPGFVGTVFVDRATAAVVRMRFTFTPSSYVDAYLDYIRISMDNALWEGRYWLPHQQMVEIRREVPVLDFPIGSVIRGRYEITNYRLNEPLAPDLFAGPRVTAVPEAQRRAFPFERDLYAQIEEEGLGPAPDLDEIRDQASTLVRNRYLGGHGPVRLYLPGASSVVRYNRAEGTVLGAGLSYRPSDAFTARVTGAYSFGRRRAQVRADASGGERWPGTRLAGFVDEPRDIGPVQASSGVVNTLSSLLDHRDYQDLFFASGFEARQQFALSRAWDLSVTTRWERHGTASNVVTADPDSDFRPVRETREGDLLSLDLGADWAGNSGFDAQGELRISSFEGDAFSRSTLGLGWHRDWLEGRRASIDVRVDGGWTAVGTPPQGLFLLGGRGTLPGYDFRSFEGDRYWLARADGTLALAWPWITGRAFAALGGTALRDAVPGDWAGADSGGTRASAGLGADLLWDVLRIELGRGLSEDGDWEFNLFASKRFWSVL